MIWILLAGVLAALIYYSFIKPMSHWKNLGVNQTTPYPLVGDSWTNIFRKFSFCEFTEWVYNMYPNSRYTGFYQFTVPTLALKDPELIKQITVKDFDHFTDHRAFVDPEADKLWGGNLFSLRGQRWREMRATLSGSFTSSKMKNMFHLMEEAAENFVHFFLDKKENVIEVEMKDTYTRYTNDVIATTAFGIKCDSLAQPKNDFYMMGPIIRYTNDVIATTAFGIKCDSLAQPKNDFYMMGKEATTLKGIKMTIKFLGYFLMPRIFKLLKVPFFEKRVADFFKSIINETIKTREEQGIVRPDMINLLLEAKKGINREENDAEETGFATVKESADIGKFKQIRNLTNDDITSQALIFFFAGFDTISTVLCFGSYELVTNKDVQDKLRDEIKETFKITNGKLSYETLLKMKYMDMVVSEMLRKWPPAPAVDRVCTKPYTIEPVTSDETPVPLNVGDVVWLPIHGIHRDPNNYPNPDKFDPERFSDENKDSIKPYTYIPFGSGPRNCIGSRFALLEIKALMFNLLLNFEIVATEKTQIPLKLDRKSFQHTAEGGFWFGLKRLKN